jgi:hypothetical protein
MQQEASQQLHRDNLPLSVPVEKIGNDVRRSDSKCENGTNRFAACTAADSGQNIVQNQGDNEPYDSQTASSSCFYNGPRERGRDSSTPERGLGGCAYEAVVPQEEQNSPLSRLRWPQFEQYGTTPPEETRDKVHGAAGPPQGSFA